LIHYQWTENPRTVLGWENPRTVLGWESLDESQDSLSCD